MGIRSIFFLWLSIVAAAVPAVAQTRYELSAPELNRTSHAILSDSELRIIDQTGRESIYLRDPTVDSAGGAYIAYRDNATGEIIRWPANGRGSMQIGTTRGGAIEFRTSRMKVMPLVDRPGGRMQNAPPPLPPQPQPPGLQPPGGLGQQPIAPPPLDAPPGPDRGPGDLFGQVWQQRQPQPSMLRLGTRDQRGQEWFLGHAGGHRLAMFPSGQTAEVDWFVVPAGRGYVRLQHLSGGDWQALAAGPGNTLTIDRVTQDARQLWRIVPTTNATSGYWLESAFAPGFALSGTPGGTVALMPVGAGVGQVWLPVPAVAPAQQPLWRTVNQEIQPNTPLAPAQIDLFNSYVMPLVILVGDRRTNAVRVVRIQPGAQVTYAFDRDAGSSLVEVYETRSPGGVWTRQQLVTQVPPATLYDLSVYEEFVQSIAIDRTGTSPNPIEDISVLPKSVGLVLLPPGAALPARGRFDAYEEARRANNPGVVRRWDPKTFDRRSAIADPIQAALQSIAPRIAPPPAEQPLTEPPPPPEPPPVINRQKF